MNKIVISDKTMELARAKRDATLAEYLKGLKTPARLECQNEKVRVFGANVRIEFRAAIFKTPAKAPSVVTA